MKSKILTLSIFASSVLLTTSTFAEEVTLDPIVVSSDFRQKKLSKTSTSVTVIGQEEVYDKASLPLIETLASSPNVNFSAGASKAKYIQIRGMGERSQFETPVNPSVGLSVDGIDFSNMTLGAGMFDVKQIEILRGPQGTKFGANAMAGVVNIQSNEPTEETKGHLEATVGNYNTRALGVALGGTLIQDTLEGRIALYKNRSDGYTYNSYLNRDDTQNIDELSFKTQLRWYVSDVHTIDFSYRHINVDNGYDAFTQDNTRTTSSDEPGKDRQKTNAFSLKSTYQINQAMHLVSQLTHSHSNIEYSYDEDWTYEGEYAAGYQAVDQYLRKKRQTDFDVRVVSDESGRIFSDTTDWTFGAYYKDYRSDLTRNYTYFTSPFTSDYHTKNIALYEQFDTHLNDKMTLVSGVRIENWKANYNDSDVNASKRQKTLVGAKIGLDYQKSVNELYYITLSRGYKPGGVNPVNSESNLPKEYRTETLWNLDIGLNSSYLNGILKNRLNFFYGKRKDQQISTSDKKKRADGSTRYSDYISNAKEGTYYGVESVLDYYPNERLHLYMGVGLLKAKFDKYTNPVTGDTKDGRTPAQSPKYQYNIGFDVAFADGWIFKSNVEGRGSYYFSNTNDQKSHAYALLNSSLEYTNENWSVVFWGRNLTNKEYHVRGFYFANNPDDWTKEELYTQPGTPRTFGLTVSYDF
ncbi:TonB-dependent receptor [hydrothermal vent metagenome]|uniref:TonB-dependent receptor n=1 Tax=hydrothermal vent metagenome TaxID=652676 RepID=A0A1W1CBA8_9ZZZZ